MIAPFAASFSAFAYFAIAVVLGLFFGFFLERAGFSSARKLTAQFYLKDWAVLKVMFTAIVVAMLGLVYFSLMGWLNMGQVYIPATFLWPQLAGGLLLGAGFIVGGY
ncbi:MAG TPA: YeeE/YedE thiosulfate transporter family protein [Terriglobia bacterium]|nr:YeeE/YedE thiosulfate transporter family protein [Terriglobia bacterium]